MIKEYNVHPQFGRIPPQNPMAEEAVLGACLLEKETFEKVSGILQTPKAFYVDSHQKIYEAMCEMHGAGMAIDLLTVTEHLRRKNELEIVGGAYALTKLTMSVLSSAHCEDHSRIIFECFAKRELIRISSEIIRKAYDDATDAFEAIEYASNEPQSILSNLSVDTFSDVGEIFQEVALEVEAQRINGNGLIGITTGYDELDRLTNGWEGGNLIILAARPSNGKTAFALNLAVNAAKKWENKPHIQPTECLVFSLESSATSLVKRMASAKSEVPLENIRRGTMEHEQQMEFNKLTQYFYTLPIKIDARSRKLSDIKRVARKWDKKRKHGKANPLNGMILIDYLQLMSLQGKGNREQEIATISRDLKELAVELDVPIIALSQLNREVEKLADKKPGLQHLRESGSLEQDANVVMFIWWEDTGEKDAFQQPVLKVKILVEKNRDGKTGAVELKFSGDLQRWENLEETKFINDYPSGVSSQYQSKTELKYGTGDEPF